jgi:cellulose synthase/poly-beta-1,6-N-acetylglucosamine synthase-like glycosyltransferase
MTLLLTWPQSLTLLLSVAYALSLVLIAAFCLLQFLLLVALLPAGRLRPVVPEEFTGDEPPIVTVQLPLYNEPFVVGRLIDKVMQLDYPKERLEVQVLDDSTDETTEIVLKKMLEYRQQGFQIHHIRRRQRKGYKAGALRHGMDSARGSLIAIFDADFLPQADFLKQVLGHFADEKVGLVQARWTHLNERYNLLTRLQALQLNVHFVVEQPGRAAGGFLLQFNGTAGVWRREAIESAGNWEADTLTEDLDLSIRAQLKGWRIVFLEKLGVPSELPAEIRGLRSQQFRWMKGGAETARKLLGRVWRSELRLSSRVMASFHLLGSSVYLPLLAMLLLSWPLLLSGKAYFPNQLVTVLSLAGLLAFFMVQFAANVWMPRASLGEKCRKALEFLLLFPLFLSFSLGLSIHNSAAVAAGWAGRSSEFVRTPKFSIISKSDRLGKPQRRSARLSAIALAEWCILLATAWALWYCWQRGQYDFLALHLMLFVGLSGLAYYSLK